MWTQNPQYEPLQVGIPSPCFFSPSDDVNIEIENIKSMYRRDLQKRKKVNVLIEVMIKRTKPKYSTVQSMKMFSDNTSPTLRPTPNINFQSRTLSDYGYACDLFFFFCIPCFLYVARTALCSN